MRTLFIVDLWKGQIVHIEVVHAQNHMPNDYRDYLEGYRAARLLSEDGAILGELVWRVASGHNIEITEMGIFEGDNRRKGWGTRLLEAAFEDMRQYFSHVEHALWKVFLFCEERNREGRAFYEARGFRLEAVLMDFYSDGNAVMYAQILK